MNKDSLENIFQLNEKVVVITGAAGLLGRRHAEAVASFGGIPVLLDLDNTPVKKLAEDLKNRYRVPAIGMVVDITNENSVALSCKQLVKEFGSIYGLVNNAANHPNRTTKNENVFNVIYSLN